MGILATLKKESAGAWPSLADYLREARHRETGALAALSAALSAPAPEQKELADAPAAGLFAMGQGELPADHLELWKKLLEATCAKNRSAPAAAKRMGMAPPWPPNLPDAFAPLVQEAEKKSEGVVSADAAKNPALLKK